MHWTEVYVGDRRGGIVGVRRRDFWGSNGKCKENSQDCERLGRKMRGWS